MRHKGLIEIALIGGVLLMVVIMPPGLLSSIVSKAFTQDKAAPPETIPQAQAQAQAQTSTLKTFRAPDGTEANLDISVLGSFTYPGDAEFCAFASKYNAEIAPKPNVMEDCDVFAALEPARKSTELIQAAQDSLLQAQIAATGNPIGGALSPPADPPAGRAKALALSALHEAIRLMPADAIGEAQLVFGTYLGDLAAVEHSYEPETLFADALTAQFGRAEITLCRLMKKDDCLSLSSEDLIIALIFVGRWTSDMDSLLLAADVAEARHASVKPSNPEQDFEFADKFSEALGYASEIAKGDMELAYIRRGITPLEKWHQQHGLSADIEMRENGVQSLGTMYGRIAFITRARSDVDKAVQFDREAVDLATNGLKESGWAATSNLGDSLTLRGEVTNQRADLDKGIELQRKALAISITERDVEAQNYSKSKLAQALVRHIRVTRSSLSRDDQLAMLAEAKTLGVEARDFFIKSNATVYLAIIDDVFRKADRELSRLKAAN